MHKRRSGVSVVLIGAALACAGYAQDEWPRWRGPANNGVARGDAPLQWSDQERIAWKAQIPGRGHSTPVIWGNRIFVTTAVRTGTPAPAPPPPPPGTAPTRKRGYSSDPQPEQRLIVLAFDRRSGKQLWEKTAKTVFPHEGYHSDYGSFASNSPVADAQHVIAFFGSNGVYCYTHDGKLVWEKDLGIKMRMLLSFGEGVAPTLEGNTLLLLYAQEGESVLIALDKNTGKELWRAPRPAGSSWAAPFIVTAGGRKQAIVAATKLVAAYDLENGKLIWQTTGLGRNVIPQPVASDSVAYVMSGYEAPNLMAIRLGREGDLTGSDAILWQSQRGNSYTPSPVLHEGKLYILTDNGTLSCLDAKTGKPYYAQQRLPKTYSFKASPVAAGGKLYLATEDGDVVVVRLGEKFEVLTTNTLQDQMFISSPVIAGGDIYLRGRNTLYCIR